ncbi:hypothetical protein AWB75_06182 [Caballeronia catudaia]|uniref:Uncharacterized protein n=1 Tax=Caballeronia catudaia TaxID=1777136 RepID=A0A158D4B2_9BURK|nr:hypothetical protein AWB75_06182 [Caballeronia catudaia]
MLTEYPLQRVPWVNAPPAQFTWITTRKGTELSGNHSDKRWQAAPEPCHRRREGDPQGDSAAAISPPR